MALAQDTKALDIASPAQGGVYCRVAAPGLLTGGLDYALPFAGNPSYFMEGESGGGGGGGTISRTFPGWQTERTYPPVPAERTYPL